MDVVETLTRRLLDVFDVSLRHPCGVCHYAYMYSDTYSCFFNKLLSRARRFHFFSFLFWGDPLHFPQTNINKMSAQAEALDELTQSDMFKQTKELVTCPESDSFVCELCKWMIPGVVGISTFSLLAILLTWPHGEWPIVVRFFQGWTDIFGFRLLIDQSKFDARKRYLIAAVPHGVVPLGSIITGAYIRQFLPSLNSTVAIASILFKMPILRQVFMWGGCIPATKSLMAKSLANEGDKVCVMSGGIAELFLSSRKREQLYLLKRRGFVRLAIETNAELVPMYIFGQTNMFDQVATSGGYMMRVSRYLSASLTYFWGQLFLPIPFSTSVTTVVGTPIPVVSPINDTEDAMLHAVEKMHAEFITSIKDLYRLHAADCGYGDKPLEIL